MFDMPQATVARAIDILRAGPMRADEFARRMWPDRCEGKTTAQLSRMGHPLLRQVAQVGYVQLVGDLWMLRPAGTADGLDDSAVETAMPTAVRTGGGLPIGLADALPVPPAVGLAVELAGATPVGVPHLEADLVARRARLLRLVQLADAPVKVTHDAALGDIAIRGWALDSLVEQACAWIVLRGRSANIYAPGEDAEMLVALTPIEAARALNLRWQQSGRPPELPDETAWLFADDGLIAMSWKPEGIDDNEWLCNREPIDEQGHRQRVAAGLA